MEVETFLDEFVRWMSDQPDIIGVALVGSHARGTASAASDVDLVILARDPAAWVSDANWPARFGAVTSQRIEDYGLVTSVRVHYEGGLEVEYGFAGEEWVAAPLENGTRAVVEAGVRILLDTNGALTRTLDSLGSVAVKAVIFDMDGLMFDTERLAREAWYRAMAEHGYALDDSVYLTAVGRTVDAACRIFLDALGPDLPIEDIEAAKARHLRKMLKPSPPLKQGLVALLDGIDDLGMLTAVASSTARAEVEHRLSSAGLRERFDVVVGGDEVALGKPAPDLFLRAGEHLGVNPGGCVVLEDSEAGIGAAAAAGMIPVMVPDLVEPSPVVRELAAAVVCSLSEVLGVLRGLRAGSRT